MPASAIVTYGIGGLALVVVSLFTFGVTRIRQPKVALRFLAWTRSESRTTSGFEELRLYAAGARLALL